MIELVLFANEAREAIPHIDAGITHFIVDTEVLGKDLRQLGFDTEIRPGTFSDLETISSLPGTTAWCRLNKFHDNTAQEVNSAINAGAAILLLPMVTRLEEVTEFKQLVDGRAKSAVMIETVEACALTPSIAMSGVDYAYFGLNDFAISRGLRTIFSALVDGSVDSARNHLPGVNFGVAGLTHINGGDPIPCTRLVEALERLQCSFTFLRRSFRRDAQLHSSQEIVEGIKRYWLHCSSRSEAEREADHQLLAQQIESSFP